jgi:hypothetical protein
MSLKIFAVFAGLLTLVTSAKPDSALAFPVVNGAVFNPASGYMISTVQIPTAHSGWEIAWIPADRFETHAAAPGGRVQTHTAVLNATTVDAEGLGGAATYAETSISTIKHYVYAAAACASTSVPDERLNGAPFANTTTATPEVND